jgi:hypothetical protein
MEAEALMARGWASRAALAVAAAASAAAALEAGLGVAALYLPYTRVHNRILDMTVALLWHHAVYNGVPVRVPLLEQYTFLLLVVASIYIIDLALALLAAANLARRRRGSVWLLNGISALTATVNIAPVAAGARVLEVYLASLAREEAYVTNIGVLYFGKLTLTRGPAYTLIQGPTRPLLAAAAAALALLILQAALEALEASRSQRRG